MPTLKHIAAEAGVSIDTVSRVLRGKNKEVWPSSIERADRIRKIAKDMQFRPNAAARSMRSKRSHIVGVLIRNAPDYPKHYLAAYELILGINAKLESHGYIVSIIRNNDVRHDPARVFQEKILDGLITLDNSLKDITEQLDTLVPKCFWLECNTWFSHNCLRRDEKQAGRLLGRSLAKQGYRKILWYAHEPSDPKTAHFSLSERLSGIKQACEEEKLAFERKIIPQSMDHQHGFKVLRFNDTLVKPMDPDCVVVMESQVAASRLFSYATAHGVLVGRDLSLASCDDTADVALTWPELTRIDFDRYGMGYEAATMFLNHLESPEESSLSKTMVGQWVPGSTAPGPDSIIQSRRITP